mmetsp:Transcript_3237/g.5180  ORF Transcript_3237/g.5180 Transcript_3237/m.5180 type:complete len:508 (+) Transcript_3237:22-1545(+)
MCIVFFKITVLPDNRRVLQLAANRDEFAARPTRRLALEQDTELICGRDLQRGGTWLAFHSTSGRFAFLTNVRVASDLLKGDKRSRGELVDKFVAITTDDAVKMTPQAFLDELEATKHEYDPYNIVFGDIASDADCYFFTNDTRDARSFQQRHAPLQHDKAYAVTNAPQLECAWPKATRGLQLFASILADDAARKHQAKPDAQTDVVSANSPANHTFSQQLYEQLFTQLLEDRQLVAPDDARLPVTGVAPHIEQLLSAIHVDLQPLPLAVLPDADDALAHDKQYGTVTACVAYVDAQGPCYVAERAYRHEKTPTRTIRAARQLHTPNEYCAPPISVACVDDEGRRIMSVAELRKSDSRLILVGDVHACFDELQELLLACNFDKSKDTVLLLGDLIGKGPEPKKVVEFARNGEKQGWLIALMGNWDDVALRIWRKELSYDETGDEMKAAVDALDDDDFRFLDSLPLSWCFPSLGILCVHAGIRPDLPLDKQDTNEGQCEHILKRLVFIY